MVITNSVLEQVGSDNEASTSQIVEAIPYTNTNRVHLILLLLSKVVIIIVMHVRIMLQSQIGNNTPSIVQEFSATVNGGHYANQIQNLIITTTIIQSGVKNTANQTQIGNVNIWSQAKL
jgi:hypothetical protein